MQNYQAEFREIPEHKIYYKEFLIQDIKEFYQTLEANNVLQQLSDQARLHPDIHIGDVGRGNLIICPIKGGFFQGEKLNGEILDFGADWNLMYSNHLNIIDTRYLLKTDDGAIISLTTNGRAAIDPELDQAIERGEYVDPALYYFRQHLFFETGSEKYQWLNGVVALAVLACKPTGEICYNAYMVK